MIVWNVYTPFRPVTEGRIGSNGQVTTFLRTQLPNGFVPRRNQKKEE